MKLLCGTGHIFVIPGKVFMKSIEWNEHPQQICYHASVQHRRQANRLKQISVNLKPQQSHKKALHDSAEHNKL